MRVVDPGNSDALAPQVLAPAEGLGKSRFAISIRERRVLLAIADLIVGAVGFFVSYLVLRPPHMPTLTVVDPIFYGVVWVVSLFIVDGYAFEIPSSRIQSAIAVFKASPLVGLAGVLAFFVVPYVITRPLIVWSTIAGALLLVVMRTTLARLLLHDSLAVRAILLGRTEPSDDIVETLRAARFECRIVAQVIGPVESDDERARVIEEARTLMHTHSAHELIVTSNDLRMLPGLVEECVTTGVRVVSASRLVERYMGRVPVDSVDTHWYLSLPDNDLWERPYAVARRIVDLLLSALISVPFLILLPILALLIKLDSTGPIFHVQRRVGQHGKEFDLLKLRTMQHHAEAEGAQFAARSDPRITRVGRILRATRLDEVPQLLNIVRGEMGFIGPRPERPEFMSLLEKQIPKFGSRLLVKPGLTGWAQVKGGYASTIPEMTRKLEYDLYYIKNRSFRLDLQILANTFVTVIGFVGR
ncbi:MAG: exopolysaccharide biosynthesis polyprenyl glycosylphosphotransferase [Candidatus Dormibacterales bacterium]